MYSHSFSSEFDSILVTGAAGFIGSNFVRSLVSNGVRVVANDVRPLPNGWPTETFVGNFFDASLLKRVSSNEFDFVIHQGAITSTLENDRLLLRTNNIEGPKALASACADSGTTFAYASSGSVYGNYDISTAIREVDDHDASVCSGPLNDYARSKLAFDDWIEREASPAWIGFRYTNVFGSGEESKGPMASILSQLLKRSALGQPLVIFEDTLSAARDFVPVEIVVASVLSAVSNRIEGGVYNLGSGTATTFAEVICWCEQLLGRHVDVQLIENPVPHRYQYWTCVNMQKLISQGAFERPSKERIFEAVAGLFSEYKIGS